MLTSSLGGRLGVNSLPIAQLDDIDADEHKGKSRDGTLPF